MVNPLNLIPPTRGEKNWDIKTNAIFTQIQSGVNGLITVVDSNGLASAAAIVTETTRATTAEGVNATAIVTETTRATTAEGLLLSKTSAATTYEPAGLSTTTQVVLSSAYTGLIQLAKNPDQLVVGAVTGDPVTSAAVIWPGGAPGTLTITARHSTGAVLSYSITYGSPVTKTFTQPTITRATSGAATNVPQIVIS